MKKTIGSDVFGGICSGHAQRGGSWARTRVWGYAHPNLRITRFKIGAMDVVNALVDYAKEFWILFGPGGKTHPGYFLEHKGHLVIEGMLCVFILYLFLLHSFKPRPHSVDPLTDKVRRRSAGHLTGTMI